MNLEDLAEKSRFSRRDLECLAAAGALAGLAGDRHRARWQVLGLDPGGPPLLRGVACREPATDLPRPSEGEDLVADYGSLGLTLGRHPLSLLRPALSRLRLRSAAEVGRLSHGSRVRAAGLVTCRQRPGTASGVTFVTLEDETGMVNVVVWRSLAERQRAVLLGSRLLGVSGVLEREGEVTHLVAKHLDDHSHLLGALDARSRDFR